MAGNGYFNSNLGQYLPDSIETWADYDADSSGNSWSGWSTWDGTPNLPLTFTTELLDYGYSTYLNYLCSVVAPLPVNITVYYGDTVDSSGGSIDSPSSISVSPNQSLSAVKARYFQFEVSVDRDSASEVTPFIQEITTGVSQELITKYFTDVNTATLNKIYDTDDYEERVYFEFPEIEGISKVTSIVTQSQLTTNRQYVLDGYVDSDDSTYANYVEERPVVPVIAIDKSHDPIRMMVLAVDRSTSTSYHVDCVFDAVVQGLPALSSNSFGNISQAT